MTSTNAQSAPVAGAALPDPRERLTRSLRVLQEDMAAGQSIGAQLYVSLDARPVASFAIGEGRPGVPMTPDTMMAWYSATKAALPVVLSRQWELGRLEIDDPVVRFIPEYGQHGKERITLRHLLTHTAGVLFVEGMGRAGLAQPTQIRLFDGDWSRFVAAVCAAKPEPNWPPGTRAAYMGGNNYTILTEVMQRVIGESYRTYVRREVLEPIGATDAWIGMPPGKFEEYGDRIGLQHNIGPDGAVRPAGVIDSAAQSLVCHAGGSGRGPMRDLSRIYELLLKRGAWDGRHILSPQSVEAVTARHRTGLVDERFGAVLDWGLGYVIDRVHFGRHCSPRTFGHGGGMNSEALCDPEHGLVMGICFNGNIGQRTNARRMELLATAVYEDRGLVAPGAPGRDHPYPSGGGEGG